MTINYTVYAPNMFDGNFSGGYDENTDKDATATNYCNAVEAELRLNYPDAIINVSFSWNESERLMVEFADGEFEPMAEELIRAIAEDIFDRQQFEWVQK